MRYASDALDEQKHPFREATGRPYLRVFVYRITMNASSLESQ